MPVKQFFYKLFPASQLFLARFFTKL